MRCLINERPLSEMKSRGQMRQKMKSFKKELLRDCFLETSLAIVKREKIIKPQE
jgi:hypothetical protein